MTSRFTHLAGKAIRNPRRALLRLVLNARLARTDVRQDRARLLRLVSRLWDVDAPALLDEYRRSSFAGWYRDRLGRLSASLGSARMGTSDQLACETLYLLVRAARPRVVVETGVLYGASSGHILAALEANGEGELHSIDLGTRPGEPPHDSLVRPDLAARWHYHVGDVRARLVPLLDALGRIDLFHHDSLHTFEHMTWEYRTAARVLAPDGVLSSLDILAADGLRGVLRENAFPAFCRRRRLRYYTVRNCGFAPLRTRLMPARLRGARPDRPPASA